MKKKLCQDESFDTVSFSFLYFPDEKPKDLSTRTTQNIVLNSRHFPQPQESLPKICKPQIQSIS